MKYLMIILTALFLVSIVAAQTPQCEYTLPPTEKGDCKNLIQTCANCTFVNITKIYYPPSNGSELNLNSPMTKFVNNYNYTFCDNNYSGTYIYSTIGNPDGNLDQANVCYEVTPSGSLFTNALSIPLYLPMILMLLIGGFFLYMGTVMQRPEYKLTFIIFAGLSMVFAISFGIIGSREVLYGFPLLYNFINSFYRIFIIGLVAVAMIVVVVTMIFVVKRAFDSRGYNIK